MSEWFASTLSWIEFHPGAAAWLQAILSVAAICIAIYVPYRQHNRAAKLAERHRKEDRLESLEAASAIAVNAMKLIQNAWDGTKSEANTHGYLLHQHDPREFDIAANALEGIELATLPDWELIEPIVELRRLILKAKPLPEVIFEGDDKRAYDPSECREELQDIKELANRHMTNIEAAVSRLKDQLDG